MQNQVSKGARFAPYFFQQLRNIAKFNYPEPEGPYKHVRLKEVVYTLAPLEHKGHDPFAMMKDIVPYLSHWWKKDGKWFFWFFCIPYFTNIADVAADNETPMKFVSSQHLLNGIKATER